MIERTREWGRLLLHFSFPASLISLSCVTLPALFYDYTARIRIKLVRVAFKDAEKIPFLVLLVVSYRIAQRLGGNFKPRGSVKGGVDISNFVDKRD